MASKSFEIGLVGAGAISAGAYTAGVVDFFVFALDNWYKAKADGKNVPSHDVLISVFSGASAGGITAALSTAYFASDQPSIKNEADATAYKGKNKLFDCWVEQIDISPMLESKDLSNKANLVSSLLDSTILSSIADNGLNVNTRSTKRPYISENFNLILTVTNLRGVPYKFNLSGGGSTEYDMSLHADYIHFEFNSNGSSLSPTRIGAKWDVFQTPSDVIKEKIKDSALASGAFPIGLAPRVLSQDISNSSDTYSSRLWDVAGICDLNSHQCIQSLPVPTAWAGQFPNTYKYEYRCVDGGVMNNEPLELARKTLSGGGRNERAGEAADKAVILIDPFPSESTFQADANLGRADLANLILSLFDALKNQARFKPDELLLAADENVFSRFIIAPSRENDKYPIACGSLGGFGGFLKRDFRAHDYFLGRRNAQKFLKDHFVLPENNPLFSGWDPSTKEKLINEFCVRNADVSIKLWKDNNSRLIPIIPLVNEAISECIEIKWPKFSDEDMNSLLEKVKNRVNSVIDRLVYQYFAKKNVLYRSFAKVIIGSKKQDVVDIVRNKIDQDLSKMKLKS